MYSPIALDRTFEPVHRHSRLAGRCEGVFWRRTDRRQVRRIILAAERYELATKGAGERNGALGAVALEVLRLLANVIDYRTGRLDPSLDYLRAKLKRSKDAIHRALKALRTHGFLDWLRRYVPTGQEGRGVQVQQTSNAYRLSIPARAMQLLGWYGRDVPLPDDQAHAQEQRKAMMDALPLDVRAMNEVQDPDLAAILSRMGALIEAERESGKRDESQSRF